MITPDALAEIERTPSEQPISLVVILRDSGASSEHAGHPSASRRERLEAWGKRFAVIGLRLRQELAAFPGVEISDVPGMPNLFGVTAPARVWKRLARQSVLGAFPDAEVAPLRIFTELGTPA